MTNNNPEQPGRRRVSIREVLEAATGRWHEVYLSLAPAFRDAVDIGNSSKHVDCPVHKGEHGDAFRLFDDWKQTGGCVCNTCGKFNTGLAALNWVNGWNNDHSVAEIAAVLGIDKVRKRGRPPKPRPANSPNPNPSTNGHTSPPTNGHSPSTNGHAAPKIDHTKRLEIERRRQKMQERWAGAIPDKGRLASYLIHRGLDMPVPPSLRLVESLPFYDGQTLAGEYPAMLAQVIHPTLGLVALHRTYLAIADATIDPTIDSLDTVVEIKQNHGKAPVESPKKLTPPIYDGATSGASIHLFPIPTTGETVAITEGIETALAVHLATQTPTWSAVSASGLAAVELPKQIKTVEIWADPGKAGQDAAKAAANRLAMEGRSVFVITPTEAIHGDSANADKLDWLDVFNKLGAAALTQAKNSAKPIELDLVSLGLPADQVTNFRTEEYTDDNGKPKKELIPLPVNEAIRHARNLTQDWPRKAAGDLFVPGANFQIQWISSPAALVGYLGSTTSRPVNWTKDTNGACSKPEFHAEWKRTATTYDSVELLPHEPKIANHFYIRETPQPGDGHSLETLLDFYACETVTDRDLLRCFAATLFWGGAGGTRPAFAVTSKHGRGSGKTKCLASFAHLAGGMIDISQNEDISEIKLRILSQEATSKRLVVIDNLKSHRFSWSELEAIITATTISGRRLYVGEGQRPNTMTFAISVNGVSFSADMSQRTIFIELAKPTYETGWFENITTFIDANKISIIADIVAFIRQPSKTLGRSSRWGSWEHGILSKLDDPATAQDLILERQNSADSDTDEIDEIEDFFAKQLQAAGYTPDTDKVHIPSRIAATWLGQATNFVRQSVTSSTRMLTQYINEGKTKCLLINPMKANGRGFIYAGINSDNDFKNEKSVDYKLESKLVIAEKERKERFSSRY